MDDVTTVQVHGLSEPEALGQVIIFAQRFGPLHADLAAHAAFPLVLTPDLLYRIWASFLPQTPWTTVSDILLSSLCREVGYELYEMDPAIRNILLGELREDSRFGETRLRELAGFLQEYIKLNLQSEEADQRHLAEAQRLTALAHTAPDEAAREIASKLSDPSRLKGAELLRIATLTETLSEQLREYSSLVQYSRGVERLAHGDQEAASSLLNRVFEENQDVQIAGVTLQRPRRAPEPVQAPKEETTPPVEVETRAPGAPRIFISYRRADSKYAVDRIRDRLTAALGDESVFRDLENIPVGLDFRTMIESEIRGCNVMLVVIGPQWANITDTQGKRRLFDPYDFTRIEVESGLRNENTSVIPVLVSDARMPGSEDLPESLAGLLFRNAISIRNDPDFHNDMERLIQGIRGLGGLIEPSIVSFEPETIYIPEGSFLMGTPPGDGIPAYETPPHEVFLPAYRIGKYPVTNAEYEAFIRETGNPVTPAMSWSGQRVPEGMENHPVTGATWYEALGYCQWLSQKTGRQYTLPTEAQWEKACRGGRNSRYPWGDEFDPARCNARQSDIAPVDKYPPQNDFGCFDLVGNIPQWTASLWGERQDAPDPQYFYPSNDDRRNDLNASSQIRRIIRGSWFQDYISQARSSARSGYLPGDDCGFRVVIQFGAGATTTPPGDENRDQEIERRLDRLYVEGLAAFYIEDWDKAFEHFQAILRERPDHKNAAEKLAQVEQKRDLVRAQATETQPRITRRLIRPEPPLPPMHFVGRLEELEELRFIILNRKSFMITGPEGIGKSTLIKQAADREAARAMPDGVVWIECWNARGNPLSLDEIVQRLFDAFYESDPPLKVSLETARPYLAAIEALVVLDDLQQQQGMYYVLTDLLPKCALLISSTESPDGDSLVSLRLGTLPADDAIELLVYRADLADKNADRSVLESICELLGRVPLALVLAGGLIEDTNTPLARVREMLSGIVTQSKDEMAAGLERANALVSALGTGPAAEQKAKIFISYGQADRNLAEFLTTRLSELGHNVFLDVASLKAGEPWDEAIDEGIKTSDFVVLLLSDAAVESQAVQSEILRAAAFRRSNGKPRVLAVRVAYEGELPESLSAFLDQAQTLTWNSERDNERLVRELVQAIQGGLAVKEPLETSRVAAADELYDQLTPEEQVIMRRTFLQLVRPGEGLEGISNPVLGVMLYPSTAEDSDRRVLNKLIQARLLRMFQRAGAGWLEIANEAVIRDWPRLAEWLEEERLRLRQRQRLTAAAEEWQRLNRDASVLWQGPSLDETLSYDDLTTLEAEFLKASQAASRSGLEDTRPVALPDDLVSAMQSNLPYEREGAVLQLARLLNGSDPGAARAAREALEHIATEDDSRRVSQAAAQALQAAASGIARSEARQAAELLERLKREFLVDVSPDWGENEGVWQPGTWALAELDRLYRVLTLMANALGGGARFAQNAGGVTVRKSDIGTHGSEALAHRVSFSTRGSLSAWTIVHEFAHAWDANYQWALSRELEKYTGGSTNRLRSTALRLTRNWDTGSNGPESKPGRYGRLPGCNRAGYFYGDQPSGSNWQFNRVEDFAESVAMYVGWERGNDLSVQARNRIVRYALPNRAKDAFGVADNWADYARYFYPEGGDYTRTKRWQFIDDLVKGKIQS